jgi:hypothetical protein
MARTVSVKLAADVASFVKDIETAEKVTDDLGHKIEETALAAEVGGKAVDGLGHDFKGTARDARDLQGEIKQLDRELAELAVAFIAADTAMNRLEISDSIQRKKGDRRKLLEVDDLLPKPAQIEAAGSKAGKQLGASIGEALSSAPVWAPFAAAGAPLLGATISAAVIGGAGVGGVIGGVLLASKDPRVQAAGTALGKSLLGQLEQDAQPFVGPVLQGIAKIEGAFQGMNGEIKSIFSVSSGFLAPLEDGVLGAVGGIVRGIDALVTKGKPVIDQLGHSFSELGNATGDALEVISGDSGDAAKALKDLTDTVSLGIEGFGYLTRGLTELYGPLTALPHLWINAGESLLGWNDTAKTTAVTATVAATAQQLLSTRVLSAGESAGKAGLQMQTYGDKMTEAADKGRGLYDSQTDVAQAIADTKKALDKNGHSLDINSQKGRDNRKVLSDLAGKLEANYEAYVKVNGEGAAAGKVAEHNRTQFVNLAKQFGIGSRAANNLADSMGLIKPKSVDVHVNTHDAIGRANAARDALNAIHGKSVSVHVSVTGLERLNQAGNRIGGFRAGGGPVSAGKAYVVGEHQAEVFVPSQDGTILPSISRYGAGYQPERMMPHWQSAGSGTGATVNVTFSGPVGNQLQLETWMSTTIDNLKRKGKI